MPIEPYNNVFVIIPDTDCNGCAKIKTTKDTALYHYPSAYIIIDGDQVHVQSINREKKIHSAAKIIIFRKVKGKNKNKDDFEIIYQSNMDIPTWLL